MKQSDDLLNIRLFLYTLHTYIYTLYMCTHTNVQYNISLADDYRVPPLPSYTAAQQVTFSYSVVWRESAVAWASRWDTYLAMSDVQIHWFAICNSVAIVLFLSGELFLFTAHHPRSN